MKNQVLNIKQMQHLKELGVDISKGSMVWLPYREMKGSPEIPIELCDKYYHLEFAYSLRPILPEEEMLYTFTLQDIIEMLPKVITSNDNRYDLILSFNGENIRYEATIPCGYDTIHIEHFNSSGFLKGFNRTLNEAAYQMLCWCAKKGYLKGGSKCRKRTS